MKPTKEQLADPKWWDENSKGYDCVFYLERNDEYIFADDNGEGSNFRLIAGGAGWQLLAKRPEPEQWKQKAPLLPDIGTEVEIIDNGSLVYGQGESGEVIGHVENCAIVRMSYGLGCFEASYLKIKKTQREEFIEKAKSRIKNMDADDIILAGKLYDAGCRFDLTEKDGE